MNDFYVVSMIAVIAMVTAVLRFLPFVIFRGNQKTPPLILHLGRSLPHAIMGMLVVYCLKSVNLTQLSGFLPELIACGVVVLLHVWKRNTLISILFGTICYMALVQA